MGGERNDRGGGRWKYIQRAESLDWDGLVEKRRRGSSLWDSITMGLEPNRAVKREKIKREKLRATKKFITAWSSLEEGGVSRGPKKRGKGERREFLVKDQNGWCQGIQSLCLREGHGNKKNYCSPTG